MIRFMWTSECGLLFGCNRYGNTQVSAFLISMCKDRKKPQLEIIDVMCVVINYTETDTIHCCMLELYSQSFIFKIQDVLLSFHVYNYTYIRLSHTLAFECVILIDSSDPSLERSVYWCHDCWFWTRLLSENISLDVCITCRLWWILQNLSFIILYIYVSMNCIYTYTITNHVLGYMKLLLFQD